MINTDTRQQVIDLLKKVDGDEKISSNQYHNTVKELKDFLSVQGFDFNETDFELSNSINHIGDDGYPWLRHAIIIKPINVLVEMVAYHHNEWDFYIDRVTSC